MSLREPVMSLREPVMSLREPEMSQAAYLVHPAANLEPRTMRNPPDKAAPQVAPLVLEKVSEDKEENSAPTTADPTNVTLKVTN